ncbi:MAG: sugar phosphate isomerase/epimerase [Firmicutes bacterium]|nr:sugar phosphate isomerase/epimerase [Bacillota bacterium]
MIIYCTDFSEKDVDFTKQNRLGLEVTKYANPVFADDFNVNREKVAQYTEGITGVSMHGAYHDTYYTSIDPLIREVAKKRFIQSMEIAAFHGIKSVVFHSSYRKFLNGFSTDAIDAFINSAVDFWKGIESCIPDGITAFIENVEDEDPEVFVQIFHGVNSPKIRCCLDIGHAYCSRSVSLNRWIDVLGKYIGHVHIHDNGGNYDDHLPLGQGAIPLAGAINKIFYTVGEDVPFVLECNLEESVKWLRNIGFDV